MSAENVLKISAASTLNRSVLRGNSTTSDLAYFCESSTLKNESVELLLYFVKKDFKFTQKCRKIAKA